MLIGDIYIKVLFFPDDIILPTDSPAKLQVMMDVAISTMNRIRLQVNPCKYEAVVFKGSFTPAINENWEAEGKVLLPQLNVKYLGVIFGANSKMNTHVEKMKVVAQIAATKTMVMLRKCPVASTNFQYQIFQTLVQPKLLYASEQWGNLNSRALDMISYDFYKFILDVPKSTRNASMIKHNDQTHQQED